MEDQHPKDKKALQYLYDKVLPALAARVHEHLSPVLPMFDDFRLERLVDTWSRDPNAVSASEISIDKGNVPRMGLRIQLLGFHRAGANSFDLSQDLVFELEAFGYEVKQDNNNIWLSKAYHQDWTTAEVEEVAEKWSGQVIERLTEKLQNLE